MLTAIATVPRSRIKSAHTSFYGILCYIITRSPILTLFFCPLRATVCDIPQPFRTQRPAPVNELCVPARLSFQMSPMYYHSICSLTPLSCAASVLLYSLTDRLLVLMGVEPICSCFSEKNHNMFQYINQQATACFLNLIELWQ